MFLFISFLLTIAGCVNWLLIGLLQYDFVAGIFGYQGSIFSRIIYIIIGAGAIFFLIKIIMQKGKIEIFNFKKKKRYEERETSHSVETAREHSHRPKHTGGYNNDDGRTNHNIEASLEYDYDDYGENGLDRSSFDREEYDSLFDEHFSRDKWFRLIF